MNILYRCDQCGFEEWREAGQEPWLCLVCGYMRWEAIDEIEGVVENGHEQPMEDADA